MRVVKRVRATSDNGFRAASRVVPSHRSCWCPGGGTWRPARHKEAGSDLPSWHFGYTGRDTVSDESLVPGQRRFGEFRTGIGKDGTVAAADSSHGDDQDGSFGRTELDEAPTPPEQGQGTVEYALIVASIAVVLIVGMAFFSGKIGHLFERAPESPEFRPPVAMCDPSYAGACIPSPPPNLSCDDLRDLGISGEVRIVGSDPHGLDSDGDGIACN